MRRLELCFALIVTMLAAGCSVVGTPTAVPTETPVPTATADPGVIAPLTDATPIPPVETRVAEVQAALLQPLPILQLSEGLSPDQQMAQGLALGDERFTADSWDALSGVPLRSEIFGIYPWRESDRTEATQDCTPETCLRVEKYNYALNQTVVAMVDVADDLVLSVNTYAQTQPDLPPRLTQLAVDIANAAPEVAAALGQAPGEGEATMANMKTALNRTICERTRHLCVAPTYMVGDRALWAIVDLTDNRLIGVRWTDLGAAQSPPVTEKTLQNDTLYTQYCDHTNHLERDGWALDYILTSSDGLRISDVTFDGKPIFDSAKLVDFHVSYSSSEGFGYSDAVGCPIFSQAAVLALEPPQVSEIIEGGKVVGFALGQDFRSEFWPLPCNYNYYQRYEFYLDGRFNMIAENRGRGCGNDGVYRPVLRVAPAGPAQFDAWDGTGFAPWTQEQWTQQTTAGLPAEKAPYQLATENGSYDIVPYWSDPTRSDTAWMYVTRRTPDRDEGDSDLVTIGSCCNTDYQQGPEKYIEPDPESLGESDIALWYVPELENDDTPGQEYCWADFNLENGIYTPVTWPCSAGLQFVPVNGATKP